LKDHRRTPELSATRERELDARVEDLARRLVEAVNQASPEQRPALREYAMELVRDGTEVGDAVPAAPPANKTNAAATNPIGIALLLGILSLPAMLLFTPVGVVLFAVALVMGVWGILATLMRR
jgi:hypothetical protein